MVVLDPEGDRAPTASPARVVRGDAVAIATDLVGANPPPAVDRRTVRTHGVAARTKWHPFGREGDVVDVKAPLARLAQGHDRSITQVADEPAMGGAVGGTVHGEEAIRQFGVQFCHPHQGRRRGDAVEAARTVHGDGHDDGIADHGVDRGDVGQVAVDGAVLMVVVAESGEGVGERRGAILDRIG